MKVLSWGEVCNIARTKRGATELEGTDGVETSSEVRAPQDPVDDGKHLVFILGGMDNCDLFSLRL